MRRLTLFCVLAFSLPACGSGGSGNGSSVQGSKDLSDLSDTEIDQLCDWAEDTRYRVTEQEFCSAVAVESSYDSEECEEIVSECVADPFDASPPCGLDSRTVAGCGATVSQFEACVRQARSFNSRYFRSASCRDLSLDDSGSLEACDALLSECPWLDGRSSNPNLDEDSGSSDDPDDGAGGDDFFDGGFVCNDGYDIDDLFVCDGGDDCRDGEDELGCSADLFECSAGVVVEADFQCDGYADCWNGFDEQGCPIETFMCDNGQTIEASAVCDFSSDCSDGSDEFGCDGGFVCADGTDRPDEVRCDFVDDCGDASDEEGCGYPCTSGVYAPGGKACDGKVDCGDGSDEDDNVCYPDEPEEFGDLD